MIAFKFLKRGAIGPFSGFSWPQPSDGRPGDWVATADEVKQCSQGIHASLTDDLLNWLDDELWEVELDGDMIALGGMVVAQRGRLLRRVDAWDESTASAFAADCALRARHRALGALRRVGLTEEAERIVQAAGLDQVQAAAATAHEATADAGAAELTGFVADAVSLAAGLRPDAWRDSVGTSTAIAQRPAAIAANVAFVVAHVAGREASAANPGDARSSYEAAYNAERAVQIAWLETAGVIDSSGIGSA